MAFEFDGLYWHSDRVLALKYGQNANTYHLEKTLACVEIGISLVHVFENEWLYRRDVVMSRVKSMFRKYDTTIYARKCGVSEVG